MSDKILSLVERRQRFIERQRELHKETVNVRFEGLNPEGTDPRNRHGMPKVPVGQHLVKNWPVLDLGEQPNIPLQDWRLEVGGLVDNPFTLTWEGQPLPREHGGPCRIITSRLYAWTGTKWIRKIEFLAHDRKGFWEERGYSNTAEPWFNDRYSY